MGLFYEVVLLLLCGTVFPFSYNIAPAPGGKTALNVKYPGMHAVSTVRGLLVVAQNKYVVFVELLLLRCFCMYVLQNTSGVDKQQPVRPRDPRVPASILIRANNSVFEGRLSCLRMSDFCVAL